MIKYFLNKVFWISLIFVIIYFVAEKSYAQETQTNNQVNNQIKNIVLLGDSLSAAYGMPIDEGWVSLMQNKLNDEYPMSYKIFNESISGDTSGNGLYRMNEILQRVEFEYMFLILGANDGLRGLPFAQMKENLRKIILMSQEQGARVFLVGINLPNNYGSFFKDKFTEVYEELTEEYDLVYLEDLLVNVPKQVEYFQEDYLHTNEVAQPIIMETVWEKLDELGIADSAQS